MANYRMILHGDDVVHRKVATVLSLACESYHK